MPLKRHEETATRASLTEQWQASQSQIDWMHAPLMPNYVNGLVSGKALEDGGHWATYARSKHLIPLLRDRGTAGLSMVSLACGSGHIEQSLVSDFQWPLSRLTGLEYDAELRRSAVARFAGSKVDADFSFFDFNADNKADRQYDIVFCCHSIHHATDVERVLQFANALLAEDGLFIGLDYFGPTRFQIEHEVQPLIKELYTLLPDELKRDLRFEDRRIHSTFPIATINEVATADISESVRSSDLRTLLFSNFPVVDIRPMGGTILRWLLQNRAGNFKAADANHVSIVRLLQFIERVLIENRAVRSDDLFFVLRKSDRF
jgi:SAM-dependent methyltransferase